jgi:hypothetical protein
MQCSSWHPSSSRQSLRCVEFINQYGQLFLLGSIHACVSEHSFLQFIRQPPRRATSPCTRRWPECPGSTSPTATRRRRRGWAPAARRPPSCGASRTPSRQRRRAFTPQAASGSNKSTGAPTQTVCHGPRVAAIKIWRF